MNHWIVVPFVLPALTACVLLLLKDRLRAQRLVSVFSMLVLLGVAAGLVVTAGGDGIGVYALGDWPARIGIVFVLTVSRH